MDNKLKRGKIKLKFICYSNKNKNKKKKNAADVYKIGERERNCGRGNKVATTTTKYIVVTKAEAKLGFN